VKAKQSELFRVKTEATASLMPAVDCCISIGCIV